tara:strand:- start:693 stop:1712 length:1020 start_codon:yes stop_codon:yes gene_type:complete
MSDLRINNITGRDGSSGPVIAGVSTVSTSAFMIMPNGNTEIRGAGSGRGLFGGGDPAINTIEYVTISSLGNAQDFGDLSTARRFPGACASATRGLFSSGLNDTIIDYVTISSGGGANDFGNKIRKGFSCHGLSDNTRGIFAGGYEPAGSVFRDTIEFVTMATTGDATDFGNLTVESCHIGTSASPTRGMMMGASTPDDSDRVISFITIQTTGNAQDFGSLTAPRDECAGASSSTRAVVAGGDSPANSNIVNRIEYVTIATTGDAQDFGDLTRARSRVSGCSNKIRGVFMNGREVESPATYSNTIDYITFASTGNATDFGDATAATHERGGCSDVHGGLG